VPIEPLFRVLLLALALAFGYLAGSVEAATIDLASHRATYTLSLDPASKSGRFTNVRGTMTMLLERTCEGWIVGQNMLMAVATSEGEEVKQGLRYTGWESSDGLRFRFVGRSQTNNQPQESKGEAKLPAGTLFPVAHTLWLIEQAMEGRR
jgi:hypothetical protein